MAGFKQAVLNNNPLLFLTFDGDSYDSVNRNLLSPTLELIDESDYANTVYLRVDSEDIHAYRMGLPSLIELEQTDNASIGFGWYGEQVGEFHKAYVEVPHNAYFGFPNFGNFTIIFSINKVGGETGFRSFINDFSSTLERPIIQKGEVFRVFFSEAFFGDHYNTYLNVETQLGNIQKDVTSLLNKTIFCAVTYNVYQSSGDGLYYGVASLYINGRTAGTASQILYDTYPNNNINAPIEIMGYGVSSPNALGNDKTTVRTMLDQVAIFQQAFSQDKINYFYKKTRSYDTIIAESGVNHYWAFDDSESTTDFTFKPRFGSFIGTLIGGNSRIVRRQSGHPQIPNSYSIGFFNGGCGAVTLPFSLNANWTVDFFVKTSDNKSGVLISAQSDNYPYNGLLAKINTRNNAYESGWIQVNITETDVLQAGTNFNNGVFHHIAIVCRDGIYELWADGAMVDATFGASSTVSAITPINLVRIMGMKPNMLSVDGYMSCLAFYSFALDPSEITLRSSYKAIYRITGNLRLQGVPYRGLIRANDYKTGKLITETYSEPVDGNYTIELYNNSKVVVSFLGLNDESIRPAISAPIAPAYFEET